MQRIGDNLIEAGIERDLARGVAVCASQALRSIVKITLRCNLLKTKGDSVWLGVRDGIRNWLQAAA